jgi:hypothetical protein
MVNATVTASTENGDNVIENAYDWNLSDYWQPTTATSHVIQIDLGAAADVDYIGFYSSDFAAMAGSTITIKADTTATPTTTRATYTVSDGGSARMDVFTLFSFRYVSLTIETTAAQAPKFQQISIGSRLDVERGLRDGFMPPTLASQNEPLTSKSENGFFLGRSLGTAPARFTLPLNNLSSTWVRANWPALLAHMERYPMFILPQPTDYPEEAIFAWTTGAIKSPAYQTSTYMQVALSLEGFS